MKLIRDMSREQGTDRLGDSYVQEILEKPYIVKSLVENLLRNYLDTTERHRSHWQYVLSLCNQVLSWEDGKDED